MRRTNRVPQTVLWSLLLGVVLGNTATAQPPPVQPVPPPTPVKEGPPGLRGNVLIVPINGTQRVQMASKRPIDKVLNPKESVLRVQPVLGDPTSVLVTGLDAGVTRLTLIDAGGVQENIDIVVQFDVEYLRTLLARVVPTAAVQPVPGSNGTVVLTGSVGHAEDVDIIMRTAASVVGGADRVINGMRFGGVMQVQLDTVVARVNRSAVRAMGFNLLESSTSTVFGNTIGNLAPSPMVSLGGAAAGGGSSMMSSVSTGTISTPGGGTANLFLGVITKSGSFLGLLEAFRNEGLAKLLNEPRLVTLSGRPATLHSGGQQAIPQPQGLGTVGVTFQNFGTDVSFLPIVLGNGKINLDILASVSQLDPNAGTTIQGTTVPGRQDQNVHAIVELEDGQTIAIGGLIQHTVQGSTQKVPILGDVPYLGAAFSRKSYNDIEEELVILVTPHVVDAMACNQLPKYLPGQETRKPDDYELFLEGILEAPRGSRVPFPDRRFVPAYKNGPTAALYPCAGDGRCGQPGHKAGQPACDSSAHPNPLPVGNLEAKPVPPVAATPPASQGEPSASSPDVAANAEQNKPAPAEANKPATLPDALPGPANTDGKR